jgi:hypothetical protein
MLVKHFYCEVLVTYHLIHNGRMCAFSVCRVGVVWDQHIRGCEVGIIVDVGQAKFKPAETCHLSVAGNWGYR